MSEDRYPKKLFSQVWNFFLKLQEKLGNGFECFNVLDSLGKSVRQRVVGRAF